MMNSGQPSTQIIETPTLYFQANQNPSGDPSAEPTVCFEHVDGRLDLDQTRRIAPIELTHINLLPVAEKRQKPAAKKTLQALGRAVGLSASLILTTGGTIAAAYFAAQSFAHDTAATALLKTEDKISSEAFDDYLQDFRSHRDAVSEQREPLAWSLIGTAAGIIAFISVLSTGNNKSAQKPRSSKRSRQA